MILKQTQGVSIATGAEGNVKFRLPRDHFLSSAQIETTHTYPMFVQILLYHDERDSIDDKPEILFSNWLRGTSGQLDLNSIILNKLIDSEKHTLKINIRNDSGATIQPTIKIFYYEKIFSQVSHYNPEDHRAIWAYDQMVERHTTAGAIEVDYVPAAGSWFELESLLITAGFSGAEDLTITIQDSAGGVLYTLMEASTTTGTFELPIRKRLEEDNTATTAESIGAVQDRIRIHYPDRLNITTSSVPAADDVLIRLRAKLKDLIPSESFTGNTQAQAAYTDDYSKVV